MANGSEQIEARLVAYIDGLLPERERADIEAYLVAHPDHRALIQELRSHKLQIGMLPRERAPAEIMDHLQGHLERQALLENVEESASSMRINRWPQVGAVAALLMLTAGLGILIYQVLPGNERPELVLAPGTMQQLPPTPSLEEKETSRDADIARAVPGAGERETKSGPRRTDFVNQAANDLSKLGMADKSVTLNNGSAIVVSTDDPMITQNLLARYLSQNEIPYEPVRADALARSGAMNLSISDEVARAALQSPPLEPIGAMVEKVNRRQRSAAESEVYVVARNVSVRQAEEISTVLNQQRGARQQATYYGNATLSGAQDLTVKNELAGNAGSQIIVGGGGDNGGFSTTVQQHDQMKQLIAGGGSGAGNLNTAPAGGTAAKTGNRPNDLNKNANSNSNTNANNNLNADVEATSQPPTTQKVASQIDPTPSAIVGEQNPGAAAQPDSAAKLSQGAENPSVNKAHAAAERGPTTQSATAMPNQSPSQIGGISEPRTDVLIVLRSEVAPPVPGAAAGTATPDSGSATTQPATQPVSRPSTTQPEVGVSVEPLTR